MADDEESVYESENDYYAEDEEYADEIEEEEAEKDELEDQVEEDVEIDVELDDEVKKPEQNIIVKKIKENDINHKIIYIRPAHLRTSSTIIQKPEMTEAIGIRISQIEQGSPIFTDVTGYTSSITMAKKEFIDRKNPLILERIMLEDDNAIYVDQFKVREMTFPVNDKEILDITNTQINELLFNKNSGSKFKLFNETKETKETKETDLKSEEPEPKEIKKAKKPKETKSKK